MAENKIVRGKVQSKGEWIGLWKQSLNYKPPYIKKVSEPIGEKNDVPAAVITIPPNWIRDAPTHEQTV